MTNPSFPSSFADPLGLDELELVEQIATAVDAGVDDAARFDELTRRAFALQYARIPALRRLCDARGVDPGALGDKEPWRRVPAVPVIAYRTQDLCVTTPQEIFRSSGTTGGDEQRSVHRHPFPGLYRRVIDATFAAACLPEPGRRPMLSLIPSRAVVGDSSLGFMADHILDTWGEAPHVRIAMGADGLDTAAARAWVEGLDGRPGTLLTTAFALAFWLDALRRDGTRLSLPAGSTIFETGGFKGRTRELTRQELLAEVEERLGTAPTSVVREYGMTEMTGHVYTDVLRGGDGDLFVVPPFMRVRMSDPETLEDVGLGRPGLVTLFDLSNVGSCLHVVTQDLGIREAGGFRLLGRASAAELRGCSLTAEELSTPDMV